MGFLRRLPGRARSALGRRFRNPCTQPLSIRRERFVRPPRLISAFNRATRRLVRPSPQIRFGDSVFCDEDEITLLLFTQTRALRRLFVPTKKMTVHRSPWSKEEVKELKTHSKARTPVAKIAKAMKRTEGALRRKAGILGIGLGHDR